MTKVISRTLDLLFALANVETGLSVGQLAAAIDLPTSTVYRFLGELEQRGLVRRSGAANYGLGPAFIRLSQIALKQLAAELPAIALPVMQNITQNTGETTILAVPSNLGAICVEVVLSSKPIRYAFEKGRILPYHAGATAVTLLAYMDDLTVRRVIDANKESYYVHGGMVTSEILEHTIRDCRSNGYVITRSEVDQGATGIGAPIFDLHGKILAALSLAGPTNRFGTDQIQTFINQIKQGASDIQERLHILGV